jgi:signal transduction histidine kinase
VIFCTWIRQAQASFPRTFTHRDRFEEMASLSGDMYEEIRCSITGLRKPTPQDEGLVPALSVFLKEFSAQTRLPVDFSTDGAETIRLSPASESQVIRIVQEALNNVCKHAQVDRARVGVERKVGWLCVSVRDDGRGFDPARPTTQGGVHFGLQTMRERAESLGGTLTIDTAPGRGTRITAIVPLELTQ